MKSLLPRLCLIADPSFGRGRILEEMVKEGIGAGARLIQYRDKHRSQKEIYKTGVALRLLTADSGSLLIVNDRVDLAMAVEADGVHLGQEDLPIETAREILGPHPIIGISTHNVDEATAAERGGASYIAFGAVYPTSSKIIGAPAGPGPIREIAACVSVPLFGIGGIRPETVPDVIRGGAHGVAVISSVFESSDIAASVRTFLDIIESCSISS